MTLPLWGEQQKSQDDSRTIAEFVTDEIQEHNDNSDAHLGSNRSLDGHKKETVIDHPAGSIPIDKLSQARVIITNFESIDGWNTFTTGSGDVILDFANLRLYTGATINSKAKLYAVPSSWVPFNTDKNFFFKTVVTFEIDTDQEARFGIGALGGGDGSSGAGFKVQNGNLFAYTEDDENVYTQSITGIDITKDHVYEIRYYADDNSFKYYIDGAEVADIVQVYTVKVDGFLFNYQIENTSANIKAFFVTDLFIEISK